jgi:hypothetical protein
MPVTFEPLRTLRRKLSGTGKLLGLFDSDGQRSGIPLVLNRSAGEISSPSVDDLGNTFDFFRDSSSGALYHSDGVSISLLGAGGAGTFAGLSDKTSVDIPGTNSPTASALAGKLNTSDVVNDLTTGGAAKAGSAQQLVALKAILDGTMLQGTGVPSNAIGVDGQLYARKDAPFDGVLYLKTAGVWAVYTTSKATFAALLAAYPPSSTYAGCVAWVDAYDCDFICKTYDSGSTYNWVPMSRYLCLLDAVTAGATMTGNGGTQVESSLVIPGKLMVTGTKMHAEAAVTYAGSDAARQAFFRHQGTSTILLDMSTTANTQLSSYAHNVMVIRNGAAGAYQPVGNRSNNSGYYQNATANFWTGNGPTFDPTADSTWQFGIAGAGFTSASSAIFEYKRVELFFPQ